VAHELDGAADFGGASERSAPPELDGAWERLLLAERALGVAVSGEEYAAAARLRDEVAALKQRLPPAKQLLLRLLADVDLGVPAPERARLTAVQALGDLGDAAALPALQLLLPSAALGGAAEASMWSCFMAAPDPAAEALLRRGMALMARAETMRAAVDAFRELAAERPLWAEAHNKLATALYMIDENAASAAACRAALALNPRHFGAASGMGIVLGNLGRYAEAIAALELAMRVNPRLAHLRAHVAQLQQLARERA
jgi:tetratricopeptide (TPR) repeat protein